MGQRTVCVHWLIKPCGHLPCASFWPLLGIQSPAETEIKANNLVLIIMQKSSCNSFVNCHLFEYQLISTQGRQQQQRQYCQILQKKYHGW